MNQLDQYNQPIPQDLMLLDETIFHPVTLSKSQTKLIDNLNWYALGDNRSPQIFVSKNELEKAFDTLFDGISPEDCFSKTAINLFNIVKIDSVLHRWSKEDGFYWA